MSTKNPEPPSDSCVKPSKHPCKEKYGNILPEEWDIDHVNLVNNAQRHRVFSYLYCLWGEKCRLGFPFNLCDETYLEFEKIQSIKFPSKYQVSIVTARNDPRLNRHQRLQLQVWHANFDINVFILFINSLCW